MTTARPPILSHSVALLAAMLLCPGGASAQAPSTSPLLNVPGVAQPPFPVEPTTPPLTPAPVTAAPPVLVAPPLSRSAAGPAPKPGKGEILLNFQGASLTDVLNYLSDAAGFVIVQEAPVSGTVNVTSRQPISAEEAVDLLNTVLIEKGYIAIRNGRILKIVKRDGAQKRDLPVQTGSDPEKIPRKDEIVTQILPVRYGEAAKLVENLRPLLADNATISANEGSNSILLTDTQTNIRRIAEIIRAIDTSVASISTIHVYQLQYANAKELATVVTQLFANNTTSGGNNQNQRGNFGRGGRGGFGGFPGGGGFGGPPGADAGGAAQSEARQANSRVIAVADDQSNSLVVSAPEELIPTISEVVQKIDTSTTDVTSTRIFNLVHADAVETADILNTLYSDATTQLSQASRNRNGQRNGNNNQRANVPGAPQAQGGAGATGSQSERALMQARVVAVGDARTNSLLVNAAKDTLAEVAEMVGRLDASDSKKQHVYIHSLEHADVDAVASVLRGMLGDQSSTSTTQSNGRLTDRQSNGASMDTSTSSNNTGGRSSR
jgi:general secretion pathway protein D